MAFPYIDNRLELRGVLENSLKISEEEKEDEQNIDKKPKSFIIESNLRESIKFNEDTPLNIKITETKDKSLKLLSLKSEKESASYYLDINDKRFWILHSVGTADVANKLVNKLVTFNPSRLDFPWFSSNSLERTNRLGKETGFTLKFVNQFINESDENYEDKLQNISMRFWGGQSLKVINNLRSDPNIKQGIALSTIGLKYKTDLGFIRANISFNGKFVAIKGDSIDSYFNLINRVKENYKLFLNSLEENYRLEYQEKEQGFKLSGGFTLIEFKSEMEDLRFFVDILTSCSYPFRIWGLWDQIEKDFFRIKGIDLHTNDKINIELTPNWMRIFLPKESCGNVISRLFTNLQHFFDSQISLRGNNDEKIVQ